MKTQNLCAYGSLVVGCRASGAALERLRAELRATWHRLDALAAVRAPGADEADALRSRLQHLFSDYHQMCAPASKQGRVC